MRSFAMENEAQAHHCQKQCGSRQGPRQQQRRQRRQRPTSLQVLLVSSWAMLIVLVSNTYGKATAFVSPSSISVSKRQTRTTQENSSKSSLQMMDFPSIQWDEVVYNAESAASAFASTSLDAEHPTAIWTSLPIMYGAGLLTSISPCVWGLLPLTMSYISTAAGERADRNAKLPTLAFAAGLASVFCSLGLVASSVGTVFGATNSQAWSDLLVPLLSSTVCFAMGLQLLELINLPLLNLNPQKSSQSLTALSSSGSGSSSTEPELFIDSSGKIIPNDSENDDSNKDNKNGLFKTFLLGGSSALVASPCATPVLTSILAYCAKTQDPALGFLLLFGYTLGYSTPLLLVAATGGQALANLKQVGNENGNDGGAYGRIGPWVTPLTAGILLWYGTNGFLTAIFGDPSLAGLAPVILE